MQKIRIDQDIKPMSEVRKGMAAFIKQIHETKRPLVITQRGKSAAVLIDAKEQISILTIRHGKQILPIDEIKT